MKKMLKPIFFFTLFYSMVGVFLFSDHMTGHDKGLAVVIIGFFLLVCAWFTFIALKANLKAGKKKGAKLFSTFSLLIWSFWMIALSTDNLFAGFIYFTPFLLSILLTTIYSFISTSQG